MYLYISIHIYIYKYLHENSCKVTFYSLNLCFAQHKFNSIPCYKDAFCYVFNFKHGQTISIDHPYLEYY